MQALVRVHYQLHSNRVEYLKTLWINQTFLDPNSDKIYDKITSVLQFILPMLSSQKLANLLYLSIKSFFFSGADSYSLRQKLYTFHFLLLFCGEMIRVICIYTILIITIKDMKMRFGNLNLPLGKSVIRFELLLQKFETSKYTTSALHYLY